MPCGWEGNRRSGIALTLVIYPLTSTVGRREPHLNSSWHTLPFTYVRIIQRENTLTHAQKPTVSQIKIQSIKWPLFQVIWVSRYQKGKTSLDLNEARDDGVWRWQWNQLDHMQTVCTSLQTDNHINTSSLNFLQAGCSSWRPTNSVKLWRQPLKKK